LTRVMIVAGEASGDLHGANLAAEARRMAPDLSFFGMGGSRLKAAGVELMVDLTHMSLMGITEIFSALGHVRSALKTLKTAMARERPAALVLIDYPDFNLSLAKEARRLGIPVFYYICPQIWAWRTGRVKKMARLVDRLLVVFPFEVEFYRKYGLEAEFIGHPLLDVMAPPRPKAEVKAELGFDPDTPLLVLLPGSRRPLVGKLLPLMLEAARLILTKRPDLNLALAQAETLNADFIESFIQDPSLGIKVAAGRSHTLQNAADAVLAASGTATLETALMLTPMVVVYRTSLLTYLLGKSMLKTEHVSIVNLIAGRRIVPELLQNEVRPDKIAAELERILMDAGGRKKMIEDLEAVRGALGEPGAGRRAAEMLLQTIGLKR